MTSMINKVGLFGYNTILKKWDAIKSTYSAIKTSTTELERIHMGKAWINNDEYFIPPTTIAHYLFMVNSISGDVHLRNFGFTSTEGPLKLHLYESPFFDVNSLGELLTLGALNRAVVNSSGMSLYKNPFVDVNSVGEHLSYLLHPTSSLGNQGAPGASTQPILEFVLDQTKAYLFSMENTATNTATIESQFFIYREEM